MKQKEKNMKGQPFFFDEHIFDEADLTNLPVEEKPEEPEFTASQVEAAKARAFEEGKKAGLKESEDSLSKQNLTLLDKMSTHISKLFDAEQQRFDQHENETVHLTLMIMKKLFPLYAEKHGNDELESILRKALIDQSIPKKLRIELHPNQQESMDAFLKQQDHGINKDIELHQNSALSENECHIIWPDGGIICNRDSIVGKIFATAKDALAERGITVHDEQEDFQDVVNTATKDNTDSNIPPSTNAETQDE